MFNPIKILTLALAAAPFAISAMPPEHMVSNIQVLTSKSQALQGPANEITVINGVLLAVGMGPYPVVITGLTEIVTLATTAANGMMGSSPINDANQAKAIADAFREFVRVHQVLLNILIGKSGLFSTVPFIGAPVSAVLRQIESIVDTIALMLINLIEAKESETDINNNAMMLKGTIGTGIASYDGLKVNPGVCKRAVNFTS